MQIIKEEVVRSKNFEEVEDFEIFVCNDEVYLKIPKGCIVSDEEFNAIDLSSKEYDYFYPMTYVVPCIAELNIKF